MLNVPHYLYPYHIGLHERNDQRLRAMFFKIATASMFLNIKAFKARM